MAPFSSVVARKGGNKNPGPDSMYEYDLLAVVNHEGQMDTGHYTNFARCYDRVSRRIYKIPRGCMFILSFVSGIDSTMKSE
jgi:hypothetical protein